MKVLRPSLFLALTLLLTLPVLAAEEAGKEEPAADPIAVHELLTAGPVPILLPAFADAEKAGRTADDLFEALPALPQHEWPRADDKFQGANGSIAWKAGHAAWQAPADSHEVRYLAFYIQSDRWQKATLTVTGEHPVLAALNGEKLSLAKKDSEEEDSPKTQTAELTLPLGKHLVALRTMNDPELETDWSFELSVTPGEHAQDGSLVVSTSPEHHADINLILNAPRLGQVGLSPDGKLAAIALSEYRNGKDRESWIEIRDTESGELKYLWRSQENPSQLVWLPVGLRLGWQTSQDGKATVWVHDLKSGTVQAVLEDVEDLGSWRWAPDGGSLFYEINRSPDPDPRKVKHVLHPADRQPWWRGRSHLMQIFVPGGLTRQVTAGPLSPNGWRLSRDGSRMLFFTSAPDLENRPYFDNKLWMMDLATLSTELVLDDRWIGDAVFGPNNDVVLLQGSPSAFDGLGRNLPEGMQANDYGGQLYLYDLKTKQPTAISKDLRPDVGWMQWSEADDMIYARTTDTQYSNFYRYDPKKKDWKKLDTGMEYTNSLALASDARIGVARGTSATTPNRLYTVDLKKNRPRLLLDPGVENYRDVELGKVETWTTTLDKGMDLDGFVYYPPGFDASRKYPLIVYYYGGTSPVTRDFGGRYPKNIWAGQDFIVYVPNPSGATGYGQEFAARHVNDWGILTAGEVIEGAKNFLAAHPYADAEKVGCMGASYGGFLTEYLVTQTDMFAAAISHAGISDISSYWGEGLWGYAYGARALAHSFPWKDRELFIGQSPLFHADQITTPLLLVHGDSDTNVPKGESDQLFTALKLLGQDVDYVQIQGQDHWILDHEQRIVWHNTILAYFTKYLKDQPQWWDEMYPEAEDY